MTRLWGMEFSDGRGARNIFFLQAALCAVADHPPLP